MYYRYIPYPYYRRYYNINPYQYRRYYYPYYNVFNGQYGNINQDIVNYGDMTDVIQDADIYQSMAPKPEVVEVIKPKKSTTTEVTITAAEISAPVNVESVD